MRFSCTYQSRYLQDKVVLITGGSRGPGLAIAEEFASQGAKLVVCARNQQELQQAQKHFFPSTTEVLTVPCDVSDPAQVQQLVEQALYRFTHRIEYTLFSLLDTLPFTAISVRSPVFTLVVNNNSMCGSNTYAVAISLSFARLLRCKRNTS